MTVVLSLSYWFLPLIIATDYRAVDDLHSVEIFMDFLIIFDILINFVSEKEKDG